MWMVPDSIINLQKAKHMEVCVDESIDVMYALLQDF